MVQIIITREEADAADAAGINPFQYIRMKFFKDFGLNFTEQELQYREDKFRYELDIESRAARITYTASGGWGHDRDERDGTKVH